MVKKILKDTFDRPRPRNGDMQTECKTDSLSCFKYKNERNKMCFIKINALESSHLK